MFRFVYLGCGSKMEYILHKNLESFMKCTYKDRIDFIELVLIKIENNKPYVCLEKENVFRLLTDENFSDRHNRKTFIFDHTNQKIVYNVTDKEWYV